MQFALNYSPAAAELVRENVIEVDRYKCPDWPETIREASCLRPAYVHFPLHAGQPDGAPPDASRIAEVLAQTCTPHVSTHLNPQLDATAGPVSHVHQAISRTIEDVKSLVERFGPERVVAENVPFWQDEPLHPRLAALPSFIRQVAEEADCGLLLDLAHARIAAQSLGMDERAYLSALPIDRLRELHVSGVQRHSGWRRDHMPMTDADWRLFDWALEQIRRGTWARPRIVACEYGGVGEPFAWRTDPAVLAEEGLRFYNHVHARDSQEAAVPHTELALST